MDQAHVSYAKNSDKQNLYKSTLTKEMKYKFLHNIFIFMAVLTVLMMYNSNVFIKMRMKLFI